MLGKFFDAAAFAILYVYAAELLPNCCKECWGWFLFRAQWRVELFNRKSSYWQVLVYYLLAFINDNTLYAFTSHPSGHDCCCWHWHWCWCCGQKITSKLSVSCLDFILGFGGDFFGHFILHLFPSTMNTEL